MAKSPTETVSKKKYVQLKAELNKANEYIQRLEAQLEGAAPNKTARVRCMETQKVIFSNKKEAHTHCRARAGGQRMRAYQCDKCYGWHVTSGGAQFFKPIREESQ